MLLEKNIVIGYENLYLSPWEYVCPRVGPLLRRHLEKKLYSSGENHNCWDGFTSMEWSWTKVKNKVINDSNTKKKTEQKDSWKILWQAMVISDNIDLSHVPLEEEKEWLPPWKMSYNKFSLMMMITLLFLLLVILMMITCIPRVSRPGSGS